MHFRLAILRLRQAISPIYFLTGVQCLNCRVITNLTAVKKPLTNGQNCLLKTSLLEDNQTARRRVKNNGQHNATKQN
jgi:hypothetical protein